MEGTNTNLNGQYEFRPYSDLVLPTILNGQYNYASSSGVWVRTDGPMVILQGAGGRMYEIVMAFPSDSSGWPPLLPTYPWRSQQADDARQKIQPPSPSRITINQSVRIQQPDEAS